jgi:hypothetical protein
VENQDLAVAVRTGADADGGSCDLGGDTGGELARNAFEAEASSASMAGAVLP